jgi:hypothetical protein
MKRIVTFDKANKPYGFVQLGANGNIPSNVTASFALSASYVTNPIININPTSDIALTVLGSKTTYVINGSVTSSINFTIANPGSQNIGDQLVIISKPNTTGPITINYNYNSSSFYITQGGSPVNPPYASFGASQQERDVAVFTFDGEMFVASWDNY